MDLIPFLSNSPTVEDCWRGVVLYGRNTASYKFALASALLEMRPQAGQLIKLEELASAFALSIARHLATSPKQITTAKGTIRRGKHPLQQTGLTTIDRTAYLAGIYQKVQLNPGSAWDTEQVVVDQFLGRGIGWGWAGFEPGACRASAMQRERQGT